MGKEEKNKTPTAADRKVSRHLTIVKARNKRITLLVVSLCVLLVLVACIFTFVHLFLRAPKDDGKILENVTVGGINIGGMTPEDAKNAIMLSLEPGITSEDMVVRLDNDTLTLSAEETRISLDVDELVEAAYNYGRTGSRYQNNLIRMQAKKRSYTIALLPYLTMDLDYIRSSVEDFCAGYNISMVDPTVELNGTRPTYQPPAEDGTGPVVVHQTLTVTMGTPESVLDPQSLYYRVLDAYSLYTMDIFYDPPVVKEPEKPNAQEIFDRYCTYPQDATIDNKTFAVTPEVYGYGFNVEALQRLIDRADYGQEITIALNFLLPDITADALAGDLFKDILASYSSVCNDPADSNRNQNLKLSCEAINGYVIKVGESFDFNQVLGPRTTDRGYRTAPTYSGATTSTIGGGIGQTASVLYYCALVSGLQIDEQHHHRYAVSYTPMGTDAAISDGTENLVFTNNTTAPIRILAEATGGTVKITFLGTESKEHLLGVESYTIQQSNPTVIYQSMTKDNVLGYKDGDVIQTGVTGYVIQLYLCRYDPESGMLISRELLETVSYERRDKIIVRIQDDEGA